ncbi:MAG: secondary thiamine-phosphate synthase enzyme YjbQ [Hyphomicrobiaceae bacterium]|nr:secondary thiamine-phosphate synthase enzyme YjbQ [Hyphomicrobiaceae bacterium]
MHQAQHEITINTRGQGLIEFTREAAGFIRESGLQTGLLTVFVRHTSASLLIQENADPNVQHDLLAFFRRLVPEGDALYVHTAEGPDDMPAHVKSALTATTLSIPVADGALLLGTWQGLYLFEHRAAAHRRRVVLHAIGSK